MSYGIIRIQKFTKGSVQGIRIHDQRQKELSHTNQDIDFSKSHLNYSLTQENENYHEVIKKRIETLELKKAVRKDAIVMAQVLVTSDHDFFSGILLDQQQKFFEDSYEFIKKTYGEKNIISATVHLDERTPHMHVNFVPVTEDNRLSAKSLFTKKTLIELQDNFYESVGRKYELERGEKGSAKKHLETQEYKNLMEKQKEIEKNIKKINTDEMQARFHLKEVKIRVDFLEESTRILQSKVEDSKKELRELMQKASAEQNKALLELEKGTMLVTVLENKESGLQEQIEGSKVKLEELSNLIKHGEQELEIQKEEYNLKKAVFTDNIGEDYGEEYQHVKKSTVGFINKEEVITMPKIKWEEFKRAYEGYGIYSEREKELENKLAFYYQQNKADRLGETREELKGLRKEVYLLKEENEKLRDRLKIERSMKTREIKETIQFERELVTQALKKFPKKIEEAVINQIEEDFKNQNEVGSENHMEMER